MICDPLNAVISERQCLINRALALERRRQRLHPEGVGPCLNCPTGNKLAASTPEKITVSLELVAGNFYKVRVMSGQVPPPVKRRVGRPRKAAA